MEDYATKLRYIGVLKISIVDIAIGLFHPEKKIQTGGVEDIPF